MELFAVAVSSYQEQTVDETTGLDPPSPPGPRSDRNPIASTQEPANTGGQGLESKS